MNRPSFYWWLPLGVITAAFLSFFLFRSPYLLGPDGYFHITYAKLLLHHGLFYAFPWASLSMWSERFSDKDLLYHFLLIPFSQFQDLQFGAKCSALFFAMGVAFFLWYWMKRENVSQIWFWTFCLFFGSPNFLFRILSPRPHTLGLLFFLLGIFALIESRWILLFCVSFFYPWAHSSWLLVVPMSALVAFSQSVQQRMFVWKPFAIACLGATLGMVIHPYFPENWHYFYVQSIHTLYMGISHSQDLGMAGEFSSYSLREFFLTNSVPLFFFCYALVGLIRDRSAYRQINLALVALTTIVMTITVRRFIELSMPMMVIFAALQLSLHKDIDRRKVVFGVLGILLSFSLQHPWTNFERDELAFQESAEYLAQTADENEVIFTCDWDSTPELFYFNQKQRYLVFLDPNFMHFDAAQTWRVWNLLAQGAFEAQSSTVLREHFHVRYGVCTQRYKRLKLALKNDPNAEIVLDGRFAYVFKLLEIQESSATVQGVKLPHEMNWLK